MPKRQAVSLEEIASEVGRLFGTTETHARKWLEQRQTLLEALSTVRDRANNLMTELGAGGSSPNRKFRTSKNAAGPLNDTPRKVRGRRKISDQTRARMKRAAQRRWAGKKKKAGGSKRGSLTSK
jgi:hypothetical protein